jgi:hypothetical protein
VTQNRVILGLLMAISLFTEARADRALPIPPSITDAEYSVYSAWLNQYFKEQPPRLLLAPQTFALPSHCDAKTQPGDSFLTESLRRLGEARFPVHTERFKIAWAYEEWQGPSRTPAEPYRLIAFSRVAFNQNRTEALFAVDNVCGGLCGNGGIFLATRKDGAWTFKRSNGCFWVA